MTAPYLLAISGRFVVLGKNPDGDSVRFIADEPQLYRLLYKGYKIRRSEDGSVQLRLEGIDAPELHYGSLSQPMGETARDALLKLLGFGELEFDISRHVIRAQNPEIRGYILTHGIDNHGRPISYIFTGENAENLVTGDWLYVNDAILAKSANVQMLSAGMAYYLVYTATPYIHRIYLREVTKQARQSRLGIWHRDMTPYFRLRNQSSITQDGQLILPKLFRRCSDYLKAVRRGFDGEINDWLIRYSRGTRVENDRVVVLDTVETYLSELIQPQNSHIALQGDLLDLVFVEK
jgi:endonuclease YncB( thermonuclease family)